MNRVICILLFTLLTFTACTTKDLPSSAHAIKAKLIMSDETMMCLSEEEEECINLAKNANLQYEDFYDWTHLNKQGSAKAANFIYENLLNNIFKN